MPEYGLVCPFLNHNPVYAYGVEFGMLWCKLQDPEIDVIEDYFLLANQEQITLAANRLGWHIVEMRSWGKDWMWVEMRRNHLFCA